LLEIHHRVNHLKTEIVQSELNIKEAFATKLTMIDEKFAKIDEKFAKIDEKFANMEKQSAVHYTTMIMAFRALGVKFDESEEQKKN